MEHWWTWRSTGFSCYISSPSESVSNLCWTTTSIFHHTDYHISFCPCIIFFVNLLTFYQWGKTPYHFHLLIRTSTWTTLELSQELFWCSYTYVAVYVSIGLPEFSNLNVRSCQHVPHCNPSSRKTINKRRGWGHYKFVSSEIKWLTDTILVKLAKILPKNLSLVHHGPYNNYF